MTEQRPTWWWGTSGAPLVDNDEFRDLVLQEDVVEVAAMVIDVPGVGGIRLECPVRVTASGGEMLTTTPLELTVLDR